MRGPERLGQAAFGGRAEDEVNVVGHQAVGPDLDAGPARLLSEQVTIDLPSSKKIASRRFPLCVTWCGRPGTTMRARRVIGNYPVDVPQYKG